MAIALTTVTATPMEQASPRARPLSLQQEGRRGGVERERARESAGAAHHSVAYAWGTLVFAGCEWRTWLVVDELGRHDGRPRVVVPEVADGLARGQKRRGWQWRGSEG